jgi:hypothetical protein
LKKTHDFSGITQAAGVTCLRMRTQSINQQRTAKPHFVIEDMSGIAQQLGGPQFIYGLHNHTVMTMTRCIKSAKKFATVKAATRWISKHANAGYGFSGTCAIRQVGA